MNKNIVNIRHADKSDFDIIYQFVNELEETNFGINDLKNVFELNIRNKDFIYLIAELNKRPIGFVSCHSQCLLHHGGKKIGEIQEMFISPEYRNKGIGKELINELKRVAEQNNIAQLEVTSNKIRIEAHRFYQREKFINTHEKFTFELK